MERERLPKKSNNWPEKRDAARAITIRKRRSNIRDLMLMGISTVDIAVRLGCSQPTVSNDIQAIFEQWALEDAETTKQKIARRVRQLELSAREAYDGFQRSKNNIETIQTAYERKPCRDCVGKGKQGNRVCKICQGTGEILIENVTRRVTGQAGDPTLLRVYMDSIKEAARIQGLYAYIKAKYNGRKKPREVFLTHIYSGVDWDKVPMEKILQIKYACAQALESGKAIDVMSEPEKENE